jgi:hypothetical protein
VEIEARAEKIETFRRLEGCITEITEMEKEVLYSLPGLMFLT